MNVPDQPLLPERVLGQPPGDQPLLDLASAGVQRYVWHSTYGDMLIEVRDGMAYINGQPVMAVEELRCLR